MSNIKTILSATATILRVIGNGYNAYGKFHEGKNLEGWKYTFNSASILYDGWDDIQKSWSILNGTSMQAIDNKGTYSGKWLGEDANMLVKHDLDDYYSTVSAERFDGRGYNVYKGSYDSSRNQFAWVGYNSDDRELILVGTPSEDDEAMFIDIFLRQNDNSIKYSNSLLYVRPFGYR